MHIARTVLALSLTLLATACAGPGTMNAMPGSAGMAPMDMGAPGAMATMEPRMKTMREMHQKMSKATPAGRQALMAEHMLAMQGGMDMMKEMHAKHGGMGAGGMGAMGSHGGATPMAGMADGKGMPSDMAQRHQMMTHHMAMMQLMMDMMADRMRPGSAPL